MSNDTYLSPKRYLLKLKPSQLKCAKENLPACLHKNTSPKARQRKIIFIMEWNEVCLFENTKQFMKQTEPLAQISHLAIYLYTVLSSEHVSNCEY